MIDRPLFSIVIPTGGRTKTLPYTLNTVLSQAENDMEVIVSDNDETDQTANLIKQIQDPRVRYIKTPARLSMTDHWNFALAATKGEYVLVLGDDDGLLGDALLRVRKAVAHNNVDVLFADLDFYQWPVQGQLGRVTQIADCTADTMVDLSVQAQRVLHMGGARWERLPSVYRTFIHRRILEKLGGTNGGVCDTVIPDMYTSFAIAGIEGLRALRLAYPLAICAMSYPQGEKQMPRVVDGKAGEALSHHMMEYGDVPLQTPLPHTLPRVFNAFTETIIVATARFPEAYKGTKLNYSAHCAWLASRSGCGTAKDFWKIREHLMPFGFKFHQFLFWYALYKIRHAYSSRQSRRTGEASKMMQSENVFDVACELTAARQKHP